MFEEQQAGGQTGVNKENRSQDRGQETARSDLVGRCQGDRSSDVLCERGSYWRVHI